MTNTYLEFYVYWTVHYLDSWITKDQLDVTCFIISLFTAQHVSNVSTSIFRSLRLIVDLFHMLYCSGLTCVGVTVWFCWGGVVSLCRLKQSFSLQDVSTEVLTSCKTAHHNCYQLHPAEPEQRTKCSNRAFDLLKMGVMMPETCWDRS